MKKNNKGFVVSAVLYPLLVLFLALIMGLLAMTDTRKRILDRMKLEISDSIFDEATCSCDTILNKLNYIIKNGVGGGGSSNIPGEIVSVDIKVTGYEAESELPASCTQNEIAVITTNEISKYYLSATAPINPEEGQVWIVQDNTSKYHLTTEESQIGISYAMQYENGKWEIKRAYLCTSEGWTLLYYIDTSDGNLEGENVQTVFNYDYTGEYQEFRATFSGYYLVELWGAQGGTMHYGGGAGGYTYGEIYLNAGEGFYVYVGRQGSGTTAGWNGGGTGGGDWGAGGGGATDIRLLPTSSTTLWNEFESLKTRIMVAAGGGGGSYGVSGGAGGGLTGNNGGGSYGVGATQSRPGYLNGNLTLSLGGFGYGGKSHSGNGAGGGGGYYGGGGANGNSSGGGGSSYISGHEGCNSISEDSTSMSITHTGLSYHYSGYYFKNTSMTSGNNSGNGKAKITLKTVEVKTDEEIKEDKEETQTRWNFTYSGTTASSGNYQTFTVPSDGQYKIELWGAKGGTLHYDGGKGAYTSGTIYLTKGMTLYIYVGGSGFGTISGWNGGGTGGGDYGAGGGGATDVRLVGTSQLTTWDTYSSLKTRIMVAAGGGGGSYQAGGGVGGRLTGNNGGGSYGLGATQSLPGYLNGNPTLSLGGFGYGGKSYSGNGAGGGGGYYGGGGASGNSSGGGGSSYISGHEGCNSIAESSTEYEIVHTGSSYHYSGYYFESTSMLSGNEVMPSPTSSSTMTGNSGDGYARITQLNKTTKSVETLKEEIYDKEKQWDYAYSGSNHTDGRYQLFEAPKDGTYSVELWGAKGGTLHYDGGKGAYTYGEVYLKAGEKYYIYVGGTGYNTISGWNGGATGGGDYGGGGGGSTDIRLLETSSITLWNDFESLKTRIMVAAGGGGGSYNVSGGAGGKLTGNNGGGTYGVGATQSLPGYLNGNPTLALGGFGYAGKSHSGHGGGGGGGYYGGGGGSGNSSGGGGSSYISGYEGVNSIDEISTSTNIIHTGSIYHYSGLYFTNPRMSAGNEIMPDPNSGSTMTGNSGDGYARIVLLKEENKDRDSLISNVKVNENLWQYGYSGTTQVSGRYQTFTVPQDGQYRIELWGSSGIAGGKGAYTSGNIYLTKGMILYLYVGSSGNGATGGWNGGGNGGSYGGGGASDIRLTNAPLISVWNNFISLKSRIMTAAGGSGTAGAALYGSSNTGSQNMGGYDSTTVVGSFGYGYSGTTNGGGGGYYGGSQGGGSSYVSGYEGCNSIEEESASNNIIHNGSAYHYSGYYFEIPVMLSGSEVMPNPTSSATMTGNSGNGHARITLVNKKSKTLTELKNEIVENEEVWKYSFSGNNPINGRYQVFNVTKSGTYSIQLWGAKGGTLHYDGGKGAYTYGEITLDKDDKLYVYVGGLGYGTTGGWNGGGTGGGDYGAGGGGSTDIRLTPTSDLNLWNEIKPLISRIMVAAGGGGGSYNVSGGAGGGLIGNNGGGSYGVGATQIKAGYLNGNPTLALGGFGYGGKSYSGNGAGGGSGWYGGGGANGNSSGGGGSSYISGHEGCIAVTSNGSPKVETYEKISDSISYTGYTFTNTQMIDGAGYPWTTEKSSSSSGMPSPTSALTQTGQSGFGYAIIKYLGA